MARVKAELSAGARLADYLTVGFLPMNCPLDKVRQALAANDAQSKRRRGLPHEVLVYFVMAMVLYANVAYEEVLRLVVEGLRPLLGDDGVSNATVTKGAISQARGQAGHRSGECLDAGDGGSQFLQLRLLATSDHDGRETVVPGPAQLAAAAGKGTGRRFLSDDPVCLRQCCWLTPPYDDS